MANSSTNGKQRVLIAGGGVAGLEVALALRDLAPERAAVDLHDPRSEFVFRPFSIGEPYGVVRAFRYDMRRLAERCDSEYSRVGIASVDPGRRLATTSDGEHEPYDQLVVATGVRMLRGVPGAVTFGGVADEGQVGEVVHGLRDGALRHVAFVMPRGRSWTLPLYELALLASRERDRNGNGRARITLVTPEDAPLQAFGRPAVEQMAGLLEERRIEVVAGAVPLEFENGRLSIAAGEELEADAVVALPRFEGRRVGGVPHDDDGFIEVDEHGRVPGLDRVYAAGDVTALPVKQGSIAAQQADAVAEAIAAAAGAELEPRPFDPTPRGILWAGQGAHYLYGKPNGKRSEAAGSNGRPRDPLHNGEVTAPYLTPFVESISAEAGDAGAGRTPSMS